jgi:hypothetical protein
MPGSQPTVEIAVLEPAIPISGSRSQAASTASRFMSGSPMPMNTAWSTRSLRRKWSAWSTISEAVRLRPNRIRPVAQKVQVSGHPDWLERQSERRPSRYRISTASTGRPSRDSNSTFSVPSRASASRRGRSEENGTSRASSRRSPRGRFVISS